MGVCGGICMCPSSLFIKKKNLDLEFIIPDIFIFLNYLLSLYNKNKHKYKAAFTASGENNSTLTKLT